MERKLKNVGVRIKQRRMEINLRQSNLSGLTGISTGNLSEIESGKKLPSTPALLALSDALKCSTDWLLRGEDSTQKLCRNEEEYIMLEMFRKLSASNRIEIHELIEFKLEKETRKKTEISSSSTTLKPNNGKDMVG